MLKSLPATTRGFCSGSCAHLQPPVFQHRLDCRRPEPGDPSVSHIFIVVPPGGTSGSPARWEKQLDKLYDVLEVEILDPSRVVKREHMMAKVGRTEESGSKLIEIANAFHAAVLHVGPETMVLELSGESRPLDSVAEMLQPFGIREMLRTGAMAMTI